MARRQLRDSSLATRIEQNIHGNQKVSNCDIASNEVSKDGTTSNLPHQLTSCRKVIMGFHFACCIQQYLNLC